MVDAVTLVLDNRGGGLRDVKGVVARAAIDEVVRAAVVDRVVPCTRVDGRDSCATRMDHVVSVAAVEQVFNSGARTAV